MEQTVILLAFVVGLSFAATVPGLAPLHKVDSPFADQYIVVLKDSANINKDREAFAGITGVSVKQEYTRVLKGFGVRVTSAAALEQIQRNPGVKYVQQDGNAELFEASMTWGLDRIDQRKLPLDDESHYNGDGSGVNVYVIDTGIYTEHEYFEGRAQFAYDASGLGKGDCHGHGTHCAGTVGAKYYGVARAVNLHAVRVLDCGGYGSSSQFIDAVDWVAKNHVSPAIASISLGYYRNEAIDEAMQGLYDAGVIAAVAAGNSNNDACHAFSPARAPSAFTVGATDHEDYRAYFSSYGSCLDIFAPGVYVLSTMVGNPTATATWSGTSMATPHVAGVMALTLGENPNLTPSEVAEKLKLDSTSGVLQDKQLGSPDRMLYAP